MRLLQNLLITDNASFFESLFLSCKTSYIVSEWAWAWQTSWCHLRKYLLSTKFTISIWGPPVIPCDLRVTFNPLPLSLKWVMTLATTTKRNMESGQFCKITNMIRVKGSERKLFVFIFRLNIILHDSYQADKIVKEIEEWEQKVPDYYVKSFSRVLLGVLEASIVS